MAPSPLSQSESFSRPNFFQSANQRSPFSTEFIFKSFHSSHSCLVQCEKNNDFVKKKVSESNSKKMPIFCNYGEVEVAAQETGQFKLSKIKLDGESPRKWYKSSVSTKKYHFRSKMVILAHFKIFFRGEFFFWILCTSQLRGISGWFQI